MGERFDNRPWSARPASDRGPKAMPGSPRSFEEGGHAGVVILVREEGVVVSPLGSSESGVPVEVVETRLLGRTSHLRLRTAETATQDEEIHARIPGEFDPVKVGPVAARLDPRFTFIYPDG